MTSHHGSKELARQIATARLIDGGWSKLSALVGGHIASFGDSCWQTYRRVSEAIRRPDGRRYHPESVARVCRQLRDRELVRHERVFVGGKMPTRAKYKASSRGTTIKAFNWRVLGERNPFTPLHRRQARQEQARELREAGELQKPPRPRHVSARAIVEPVQMPTARDPFFERQAARIQADQALAEQRRRELAEASARARTGEPERARPPERPPDK